MSKIDFDKPMRVVGSGKTDIRDPLIKQCVKVICDNWYVITDDGCGHRVNMLPSIKIETITQPKRRYQAQWKSGRCSSWYYHKPEYVTVYASPQDEIIAWLIEETDENGQITYLREEI